MTDTTFTVPQVPGSSRKSKRSYTHAVIGRNDLTRARREAADTVSHCDVKNYEHRMRVINAGVGGTWDHLRNGSPMIVDAAMHADYVKRMKPYADVNEYVAGCIECRVARVNEQGTGTAGELHVLQWSMSAANAAKAVNGFRQYHVDVAVVPCVEVPKKSKAK